MILYCQVCGEKQSEGANFCRKCGTPQTEDNSKEIMVKKTNSDEDSLSLFVGDNSDFYFEKWGILHGEHGEVRKTSWNWASFLVGFQWLGYRKMYKVIFVILLIWLIIDGLLFILNAYHTSIDILIGLTTYLILGFKGNYLYYSHALREINKLKKGSFLAEDIKKSGGRNIWGIFASFGLFFLYVVISSLLFSSTTSPFATEQVAFGYDIKNGEIVDPYQYFETEEEIYYSFYFPDSKGGSYKVVIEKVNDDSAEIYDSWESEVPPDWEGLYDTFITPSELGEYELKIIKENEVIAKGTFYVL